MRDYDLAPALTDQVWGSLQNCLDEAVEMTEPAAFAARTSSSHDEVEALWSHLDQGRDAHPLLSRHELSLAASCIDLACELVDDIEFDARVGMEKPEAERLATALRTAASR